jgi:hypothetical protein
MLARRWGMGELSRAEWDAAREGLSARAQARRDQLGALSVPAFDGAHVAERWPEMGLAGRRSILRAVFARIEVLKATTTRYDPNRVRLVWRHEERIRSVGVGVAAASSAPSAPSA